jgi:predicted GIY-YIG superfamily endonuclease
MLATGVRVVNTIVPGAGSMMKGESFLVTRKKITLILRWSARIRWTAENASSIPQQAGVYVLVTKHTDDKYYRDYVGQSIDLRERFVAHHSASEPNACIRRKLRDEVAYFRYALLASEADRLDAEQAVYDKYNPACNQGRPPGSGRGYDVELDER